MTTSFREIVRLPEFERDLKKLRKRFRSLEDDLKVFVEVELKLFHKLGVDNGGVVEIAGLGIGNPRVFKARKFACRSLRGRGAQSGIRVTYAYFGESDSIELIEIYFKGDKENEDRQRIIERYRME